MDKKQGKPYWIVDETGRKLVYNGAPDWELVPATEDNTPAWLWDKMSTADGVLWAATIQPIEDEFILGEIGRLLAKIADI